MGQVSTESGRLGTIEQRWPNTSIGCTVPARNDILLTATLGTVAGACRRYAGGSPTSRPLSEALG